MLGIVEVMTSKVEMLWSLTCLIDSKHAPKDTTFSLLWTAVSRARLQTQAFALLMSKLLQYQAIDKILGSFIYDVSLLFEFDVGTLKDISFT